MSVPQVPAKAVAEAHARLPIDQPVPAAAAQPDAVPQPIPAAAQVQAHVQVDANG